jgi:hypothetical protein
MPDQPEHTSTPVHSKPSLKKLSLEEIRQNDLSAKKIDTPEPNATATKEP